MKTCLKCKENKVDSEFGTDKYKKDGLNAICKKCIRIRSANQRKNDPEYHKNYADKYRKENRKRLRDESRIRYYENRDERLKKDREWYAKNRLKIALRRKKERQNPIKKAKNRIRMREWRKNNRHKFNLSVKKWQLANRHKTNAHARIHWAVEKGKINRSEYCEECMKFCKTEGHHEDYSKKLDVIWLCRSCHASKIEKL